jgi:hypothetical protein
MRAVGFALVAVSLLATARTPAESQAGAGAQLAQPAQCTPTSPPGPLPFSPGEKLEYSIGGRVAGGVIPLPVSGTATMEVFGLEPVRGLSALHVGFAVKGRALGVFKVDDKYDSWIDTRMVASLRFVERIRNTGYTADRHYEIFPERRQFQRDTNPPERSVEHPLDEGSFLYFIRTVPLEVGRTCSFNYYFKPDRNPVTVEVVRRERIHVAGRDWNALLIRPTILTSERGFFSKDSEAQIWLSDDANRIILQIKSQFSLGTTLNLALKSYRLATPGRTPSP